MISNRVRKYLLLCMFFVFVMSTSLMCIELYQDILWLFSKEVGRIHYVSKDKTQYVGLSFDINKNLVSFNICSLVVLLCLATGGAIFTCNEFLTEGEGETAKIVPEESTPYKKLMETI